MTTRMSSLPTKVAALMILSCVVHSAEPWHHPLSYARDGYWRVRVAVDVRNPSDRDFEGEPVQLSVGKLGLDGRRAEAIRVVSSKGHEALFDITASDGGFRRAGKLTAGDTIFFRIDCPKGAAARYWVYAHNPSAIAVPDFSRAGLVNGGFEAGADKPDGWTAWGIDETHRVSRVTENPHSGKYCTKTVVAPGAKPTWIKWLQQGIPIVPGNRYRMTGWVRCEGVKGNVGWYIHVNGVRPQMLNRSLRAAGGTHGWQKVSFEFTAPEESDNAGVGTLLHGTGTAYFDDVALVCLSERGRAEVAVGQKETLTLDETRATSTWHRKECRTRATVRAFNLSDNPLRQVVVRAELNRAVCLAKRYGRVASVRVTDADGRPLTHVTMEDRRHNLKQSVGGGQVRPEVRTNDRVLLIADLPPRSIKPFHIYFAPTLPKPSAREMSLAALVRSPANLAKNGDFESGGDELPNWPTSTEKLAKRNFRFKVARGGTVGDRCIEMTVPPDARLAWSGWRQYGVPVKPRAAYLFAGYVKTEGVRDGTVRLHGHWKRADGKLATSPFFSVGKGLAADTDWTLCMGAVRAPADAAAVDLHLTMNARGTVWHDGVLLCEIVNAEGGSLDLARPPKAAATAYDLWKVNPLVKVFPDDPPDEAVKSVHIAAARNEREVFQIVARANRPLKGFNVSVSKLVNARGHALADVEAARVGFVPIDNKSSYFSSKLSEWHRMMPNNAGRTDAWVGEWPDPIPPFTKRDLAPGRNLPLWLTVHVRTDDPAGEYRGSVTVAADNAKTTVIPVTLTVWDFGLPKVSNLRVIFDLRSGPRGGVFGGRDPKARLKKWYKFLADHRVSPGLLWPHAKLRYKNGKVSYDFTEFDELATYCFDELGMNVFYTPWHFYAFGWARKPKKFCGHEAFTPEHARAFTDAYRQYMNHLKQKGWYDKAVYYISDEPHYRHDFVVEQMKKMCDLAHRADPNVPIFSSTWRHVPAWNGYLDIWGVGQYGCFPVDEMKRRLEAGEKLWFTTDGQMALDTPYCGTERLLPYYCFKYGVKGYEFWGVSWWTYDPWKYGWHTFRRQSPDGVNYRWVRYPNGDGYLAYPGEGIGREEPVSTIRLAQVREGVEDYEYFVLLGNLIAKGKTAGVNTTEAARALDAVRDLVTIPNAGGYRSTDIMPDPDAIPSARRAVAEQIVALKRRLGRR